MLDKVVPAISLLILLFLVHSLIPTVFNKRINRRVIRKTGTKNKLLLTFDDGPDSRYIFDLLDVLDEVDVKAIFFMVAKNALANPHAVKEIVNRGHLIGLHSLEHKNAMFYSYFYTKKDFEESVDIMRSLGIKPSYYRPPWGHTNIFTMYFARKYGLKIMLWDVMAEDWRGNTNAREISSKIVKRVGCNSIICLHDAGENSGGAKGAPRNTIEALKTAIPKLKEEGYEIISCRSAKNS